MIIETNNIPRGVGLSVLQAVCLIHEHGALSCNTLAEKIGVCSASVTSIVDNGIVAGVLDRKIDPNDRRVINIQLTRAGKALVRKLQPKGAVA